MLGPNGAGKTTLIRIINQITAPDSGEVFLEGRRMTRADIGQIGYLPEEWGLYKKMKIGEQAIYLAQLKGMSRHDAIKNLKMWFEKFEIMSWWNKNIEELSKGMQQKVQFKDLPIFVLEVHLWHCIFLQKHKDVPCNDNDLRFVHCTRLQIHNLMNHLK